MSEFKLIDKREVVGMFADPLFKKIGVDAIATDYARIRGINTYSASGSDKYGLWFSNTVVKEEIGYCIDADMVYAFGNGSNETYITSYYNNGCRPIVSKEFILNNGRLIASKDGLDEYVYGEYPKDVVSKLIADDLERLYNTNRCKFTGKEYTFINFNDSEMKYQEIEYKGKKYIRVDGLFPFLIEKMSDIYMTDSYAVWLEVKPVKWFTHNSSHIAVSQNILFSGVKYENLENYLDMYFSKDIIPSNGIKKGLVSTEDLVDTDRFNDVLEREHNPYGFNLENVTEEEIIKGALQSDMPVFLHGRSSDGKSARVKQYDPDCEIVYLRNATPDSLNGKSVYNADTGEMIDIPPTWYKNLCEKCEAEPDKIHIVFFDEITNSLPSIQGMAFNIVLDKEVNGIWKLPDNARIVAAGNEVKDSLAANEIAEPLFNRFAHVYIKTTVESWLQWASEHNIHPAIYAYIAYKKGETLRTKYDGEKPNADPRKWEMASKMLYATGRPEMLRALVGEDITREFCQFCNQRVITLEDVLKGNYTERDLQMNTSEIYATAMGLSQVDEANFAKVREFVLKLGGEACAIFDSLWTHGDEARMEIVAEARLANNRGGRRV